MSKPTAAQLLALRLAAKESIRYYKGGWYSIPDCVIGSDNQQAHGAVATTISPATLKSCVARGWLSESGEDIYAKRWEITDLGRVVLAAF